MKASDIETARNLLSEYCGLCDSVVEWMHVDFDRTPALIKFGLIARKLDGSPWRIALSFEEVTAFRFGFTKLHCGSVFTEGFRVAYDGRELLFDFDDDPDNDLSQSDWNASSTRWLTCAAVKIEDTASYLPTLDS